MAEMIGDPTKMTTLAEFRALLPAENTAIALHENLIGRHATVPGPKGDLPMIYADYVASGRALAVIEDFIRDRVLPYYANSHTEASHCGATMTRLRREARAEIARLCDAGDECAVIFSGSGATAGLNRLVDLLGARARPGKPRTTVMVGPYEHHSNILPWRESGAEVIEIAEAPCGGPDLADLEDKLHQAQGPVIGAFSAMSNVSGIISDVPAVTALLNRYGAKVVWDYAGAGPYLPITMQPEGAQIDAIVVSPHKFVGGPGGSGVMILRRSAACLSRPSQPGGGTVRFVSSQGQDYNQSLEGREEGGTPNVIGDLRAAMAFMVKDAIGQDWIETRNAELARRALETARDCPAIEVMGKSDCPRVPVLSFRLRDRQGGYFHQQLVTRVLSDHFGIQSRGGCACAGPYVLQLFGLDASGAEQVRQAILRGDDLARPGFVRLNLSYLMDEDEIAHILSALRSLPAVLAEVADDYVGDPQTSIFRLKADLPGAA